MAQAEDPHSSQAWSKAWLWEEEYHQSCHRKSCVCLSGHFPLPQRNCPTTGKSSHTVQLPVIPKVNSLCFVICEARKRWVYGGLTCWCIYGIPCFEGEREEDCCSD